MMATNSRYEDSTKRATQSEKNVYHVVVMHSHNQSVSTRVSQLSMECYRDREDALSCDELGRQMQNYHGAQASH
jgi:hypothetical protein